jgi:hypothetical protein
MRRLLPIPKWLPDIGSGCTKIDLFEEEGAAGF